MTPKERFILETKEYRDPEQNKNTWSQLKCKIFEVKEDKTRSQIGEFVRNYHTLYNTWEPFVQDGKFYALCSPNYTGTSVISLPDCKFIASEPISGFGFCPTGFHVPTDMRAWIDDKEQKPLPEQWVGKVGFVCGCMWGDDTSWKVEFLDLSEIKDGKILRDDRFGYVSLPGSAENLKDHVYINDCTEDFSDELHINLVVETFWCGGLKKEDE